MFIHNKRENTKINKSFQFWEIERSNEKLRCLIYNLIKFSIGWQMNLILKSKQEPVENAFGIKRIHDYTRYVQETISPVIGLWKKRDTCND